jgi:lysine 2,3-aminomutase
MVAVEPKETITPFEGKPRGTEVLLPHGGLPESLPPYLLNLVEKTGGPTGPIGLQFIAQPQLEQEGFVGGEQDPLMEDHHEVAPGVVYKYQANKTKDGISFTGRALFTITRNCAAYCRFCTRGREVGIPSGQEAAGLVGALAYTPRLSRSQIDEAIEFFAKEDGLNEVILSGGDPLTVHPEVFSYVLGKLGDLQKQEKLDIVRIGTRVPIHNPSMVTDKHIEAISKLHNPYIMLHINHPLEMTDEAIKVFDRLRKDAGARLMGQSVLLHGVNDDTEVLHRLFNKMVKEGVQPYYVFQNDPVYWASHFTVPIEDAIALWVKLRPMLSGVAATARFVIDVPGGYGKVAIPEGDSWNIDWGDGYRDFKGTIFPFK